MRRLPVSIGRRVRPDGHARRQVGVARSNEDGLTGATRHPNPTGAIIGLDHCERIAGYRSSRDGFRNEQYRTTLAVRARSSAVSTTFWMPRGGRRIGAGPKPQPRALTGVTELNDVHPRGRPRRDRQAQVSLSPVRAPRYVAAAFATLRFT